MLMLFSPAKTLDFDSPGPRALFSEPVFLERATLHIKKRRPFTAPTLGQLMTMSPAPAKLNAERDRRWAGPAADAGRDAKQAIFAFHGDGYKGRDARSKTPPRVRFAQQQLRIHLRIHSGLYGVLRPLDAIEPYGLEMGTRLADSRSNVYGFWRARVSGAWNAHLEALPRRVVINLAFEEDFKAPMSARSRRRL